jgi:protein translocase SEC61 complex gamma subunit
MIDRIKDFVRGSAHVFNVATRPRLKEFDRIVKVTGASMILIGLAGVAITFVMSFVMNAGTGA